MYSELCLRIYFPLYFCTPFFLFLKLNILERCLEYIRRGQLYSVLSCLFLPPPPPGCVMVVKYMLWIIKRELFSCGIGLFMDLSVQNLYNLQEGANHYTWNQNVSLNFTGICDTTVCILRLTEKTLI